MIFWILKFVIELTLGFCHLTFFVQAVILAAGRGVRMGEKTKEIPKSLLPVAGKPVLEYVFSELPDKIIEVILVIGYLGDQIQEHFGTRYGRLKIKYVEQKERKGTGHALRICQPYLRNRFIVLMGDDLYCRQDIERCLKHRLCLLAVEVDNPQNYGVLKLNKKGALIDVIEKPEVPPSNLVNTAFYVLDQRFFDYKLVSYKNHDGRIEYGLPQTVAVMAKDHPVYIEKATHWFALTFSEDIKKAEEWLKKRT